MGIVCRSADANLDVLNRVRKYPVFGGSSLCQVAILAAQYGKG